jgi:hypothetical protein
LDADESEVGVTGGYFQSEVKRTLHFSATSFRVISPERVVFRAKTLVKWGFCKSLD